MGLSRKVTLADVVVCLIIGLIVLGMSVSIYGPSRYVTKLSVCTANLMGMGKAIALYTNSYHGSFPLATAARMRDSGSPGEGLHARPNERTVLMFDYGQAVAGATGGLHRWQGVVDDASNVQADYPRVRLADKDGSYAFPSRELWLLVRGNYAQTNQFVCASTDHYGDACDADRPASAEHVTDVKKALGLHEETETVPAAKLWDFLQPDMLDYGYMFAHDANGVQANQGIDPQYPVMADSNPYIRPIRAGDKVPKASNTQNSPNHLYEGQNVLFADGHERFCDRPTVGLGGDNIYTGWYSRPDKNRELDVPGVAPQVVPGAPGEPPANYLFDIVSRTDALILP